MRDDRDLHDPKYRRSSRGADAPASWLVVACVVVLCIFALGLMWLEAKLLVVI